jgi:ATP-binding cassette subfamily B protein
MGQSSGGAAESSGARARRRRLGPLWRLAPYVAAHGKDAVLGLMAILVAGAAALALTVGVRLLVDRGFMVRTEQALLLGFAGMGVLIVVFALSTALRIYFVNKLGEEVAMDLRTAAYRHVLTLDLAQVLKVRTGELLSRITTDMTMVERMVGTCLPVALRCSVVLIGSLGLLLALSPGFTALVLVLLPIGLAPLLLYARKVRRLSVRAQDRFAEAIGYASEGLEGLETVLAFGQERGVGQRFTESLAEAFRHSRRVITARVMMTGMFIVLLFGGLIAVLYRCAVAVFIHHTMTGGALVQLLALAMLSASSARELGEVWGEMNKAFGALERIYEVLDLEPAVTAPARPTPLPSPARGAIVFRNVAFAYPGREDCPALRDFSLTVRPGERVALVGPSGGGKSTVLRLLLRFYDPQAGSVSLDGVDLRAADPREVRRRIALVAQEAHLFSGTAADNIRFGNPDCSPEAVQAAARAAQAEAFLSALPNGLETSIGERARSLSGGQRQRISIARALVRNAPILLLDEATSALDAENERMVQLAIHEAMEGRTSLVIAHRLATVMEADRIIVMDGGRVVEEGSHAELSARGGLYARLARLQFAASAA